MSFFHKKKVFDLQNESYPKVSGNEAINCEIDRTIENK